MLLRWGRVSRLFKPGSWAAAGLWFPDQRFLLPMDQWIFFTTAKINAAGQSRARNVIIIRLLSFCLKVSSLWLLLNSCLLIWCLQSYTTPVARLQGTFGMGLCGPDRDMFDGTCEVDATCTDTNLP